jgi:hypothetical protein
MNEEGSVRTGTTVLRLSVKSVCMGMRVRKESSDVQYYMIQNLWYHHIRMNGIDGARSKSGAELYQARLTRPEHEGQ